MNSLLCPARNAMTLGARHIFKPIPTSRCLALGGPNLSLRRCFHESQRRLAEYAGEAEGSEIAKSNFLKEYRDTIDCAHQNFPWSRDTFNTSDMGVNEYTVNGFLTNVSSLSESLVFGRVWSGEGSESEDQTLQIICRVPEQCAQLKMMRLHSPISVTGIIGLKRASKKDKEGPQPPAGLQFRRQVELSASKVKCLNTVANAHITSEHIYPPSSRHLQIRFDAGLKQRLFLRAEIVAFIRRTFLRTFTEVETPILFKSTPEGAREFIVPTRKEGYAYALPQSPQQYKQILMASGFGRYFQFAKCFRDEDLRADRQPEFTQLDMEMAFADGRFVMSKVETLIKSIYHFLAQKNNDTNFQAKVVSAALPSDNFHRMSYAHAMSRHGSDKPDLRIDALIYPIGNAVPAQLRGMLTSIPNPVIEAFKFRLDATPKEVQKFIRKFMDSPEAEPSRSNPDGAPGFCVVDSMQPVQGLHTFGFDGAEQLKSIWEDERRHRYQDKATFKSKQKFEDGDLIVMQARERLPLSGGSTALGRLRLAIHKAAISEKLIEPDPSHRYLWVVDFPMFTPDNTTDPGQGGTAGFSATHHPFTAPKTADDVDLLLTNPLDAKADHYDLVVNGVELGGGSRRIHNAEMQKFVMRDILKMSPERINDFSHLFKALESGCPPHAGFAIGFDRFVAVLTGCESVRDVIAFPKSSKGEDMMVKSPSKITDMELARYHLALADDVAKEVSPDADVDTVVSGTLFEKVAIQEPAVEATMEEPIVEDVHVEGQDAEISTVEEGIEEDTITGETIVEKKPVAEERSDGDSAIDILFPKH